MKFQINDRELVKLIYRCFNMVHNARGSEKKSNFVLSKCFITAEARQLKRFITPVAREFF